MEGKPKYSHSENDKDTIHPENDEETSRMGDRLDDGIYGPGKDVKVNANKIGFHNLNTGAMYHPSTGRALHKNLTRSNEEETVDPPV